MINWPSGCPHGDPTCPCQDGTPAACHYEGDDPMPCPNLPPGAEPSVITVPADAHGPAIEVLRSGHCHVEGCEWDRKTCGLALLRIPSPGDNEEVRPGSPHWPCGAARSADILIESLGW